MSFKKPLSCALFEYISQKVRVFRASGENVFLKVILVLGSRNQLYMGFLHMVSIIIICNGHFFQLHSIFYCRPSYHSLQRATFKSVKCTSEKFLKGTISLLCGTVVFSVVHWLCNPTIVNLNLLIRLWTVVFVHLCHASDLGYLALGV